MKQFKPYLAIDIETTGLLSDSDILEIAAIYDDGSEKIEDLKTFHGYIKYKSFKYAEMFAINMNKDLIDSIIASTESKYPSDQFSAFDGFLHSIRGTDFRQNTKADRLTVAGKNVSGFDIPVLTANFKYYNGLDITQHFKHRTLDIGSMYFPDFGENVTLSKINELTGRKQVSHKAIDDALDIVYAIRYKMNQ